MTDKTISLPKRILLINPPSGLYRRDDRCQSRVEDQTVRVILPPIDLAILGALAREAGWEPSVADYPAMACDWERLRTDLETRRPHAILFNVTTNTLAADLETARLAKANNPETITIARGEVFEREGERIMDECPQLDMALCGEPELTFRSLLQGHAPASLQALLYRDGPDIRRNPGRAFINDLDTLPLPARDLLDNTLYLNPETGRPITVIKANRGCFAHCVFCPAGNISGHNLRLRSTDSVVTEVRQCVEQYGIRDFLFDGDTFTARKSWLLELCGKLEATNLDIRWGCNSRVDTMDLDRARALQRSGCTLVAFGVESGDQEMLDRMKKGTQLQQARDAVAACKKVGLRTHAFFIIGLPWETEESLRRTCDFIREIDTDFFDINVATPLPGTEFFEIAERENLFVEKQTEGNYATATVRTFTLSPQRLTQWRQRTLLRLYARPRYIARTLLQAWRMGLLPHYIKAAWQRLRTLMG